VSDFQFYVPVLSLINDQYEPLPGMIEAHLNWLKEQGAEGILVMGTTGEFPNFSVAERQRYLDAVLSVNPGLKVMVNVGAASFGDARALQAHALAQSQVTSLLMMPPFYFPDSAINGLDRFVGEILKQQPEAIPFYLYHYPKLSQVSVTIELLTQFPQLAGLKDTSGDFERIGRLVQEFPEKQVFVGTDFQIRKSVELGCTGIISGLGNLFPDLDVRAIRGDSSAQEALESLKDVFGRYAKIPAMKLCLNHLGLSPETTRCSLPFTNLKDEEAEDVLSSCQKILEKVPAHVG
jgi:4-hydroxy-tetrahydrodipicolinate synthase